MQPGVGAMRARLRRLAPTATPGAARGGMSKEKEKFYLFPTTEHTHIWTIWR